MGTEEMKDYKAEINDYYHKGKSKDFLYGYIQRLYDSKSINLGEGMYLRTLVGQCKPEAGSKYIMEEKNDRTTTIQCNKEKG